MAANYSHTTRATGTTLTASIYNADHQNHINNMVPATIDDYSTNVAQMQLVTDPYPSSTESLAGSLGGELERIRFMIKSMTGKAQWYMPPDAVIGGGNAAQTNTANTFTGAQTITTSATGGQLVIISTEASAAAGPDIKLRRTSASPASGDVLGALRFEGRDSLTNTLQFASIFAEAEDVTDGSEDGIICFNITRGGTAADRWNFTEAIYKEGLTAKGSGSIHANAFYDDSVLLNPEGLANGRLYFNITDGIRDSFGVNSIVDNGAGLWTVNPLVAQPNALYSVFGTLSQEIATNRVCSVMVEAKTTTSFQVMLLSVSPGGNTAITTPEILDIMWMGDKPTS